MYRCPSGKAQIRYIKFNDSLQNMYKFVFSLSIRCVCVWLLLKSDYFVSLIWFPTKNLRLLIHGFGKTFRICYAGAIFGVFAMSFCFEAVLFSSVAFLAASKWENLRKVSVCTFGYIDCFALMNVKYINCSEDLKKLCHGSIANEILTVNIQVINGKFIRIRVFSIFWPSPQ